MSDMAGLAGQAASAGDSVLLGDLVYSQLVNQIFTGKLQPGSPLSVPAIAAQLQVSRSPVRDSVQRLIAEGLAVHVPHAGARVAQVDSETIAQVMAVRRILDEYAAREAAERASETEVVSLAALLERHADQLVRDPDPLTDARLDLEFHTAVRDLAGSPPLSEALHRLDTKAHLYNSGLWSDPRSRETALREHRRIAAAIEVGDADEAARAAAAHVSSVLVRMRRRARHD